MKKRQFESLCKQLLPHLPGFSCKGWLLFMKPINHILRGFCCDDSGLDSTKFAVTTFCLPLYVPTDHITFLFGDRLRNDRGCEIWWDINDGNLTSQLLARIEGQGIPYLSKMDDPRRLEEVAHDLPSTQEGYKWETIAYSLARAGDIDQAVAALEQLVNLLDKKISWQRDMADRSQVLKAKLVENPSEAQQQLEAWEAESARNLGLEEFRQVV
jgi:hypothetical protein